MKTLFQKGLTYVLLAAAAFLLLGGFLFFSNAKAQTQAPHCVTTAQVVAVLQANPDTMRVYVLQRDQVTRAALLFHALPPRSDEPFDTALLVEDTDGMGVILLGREGVFCSRLKVPTPKSWTEVRKYVMGVEA